MEKLKRISINTFPAAQAAKTAQIQPINKNNFIFKNI